MIRETPGIHVVFHPKMLKLPGLPRIIGTKGGESSIFGVVFLVFGKFTNRAAHHRSLSVLFSSSSISLARSAKLASR